MPWCYGAWLSTHRSAMPSGSGSGPVYRTQAIFDEVGPEPGEPCAEWNASVRAVRTTHRAVAVQVPLAFK